MSEEPKKKRRGFLGFGKDKDETPVSEEKQDTIPMNQATDPAAEVYSEGDEMSSSYEKAEPISAEAIEAVLPSAAAKVEEPKTEAPIPDGWGRLTEEHKDGRQLLVSAEPKGEGLLAFWRLSRSRQQNRWVAHGRWCSFLTRVDLPPGVNYLYYKEVNK